MPGEDDDIRELFAAARPDAGPTLGIDPEAIARDGGRIRRRRRRLQWAGSSFAVVLMLVAIVVIVAALPHDPVGPTTPGGPLTPAPLTPGPVSSTPATPSPMNTTTPTPPRPPSTSVPALVPGTAPFTTAATVWPPAGSTGADPPRPTAGASATR